MDAVCVLLMSYATCNINVVSSTLVCNKHLLYTICYSLVGEGNWDFPSRIIKQKGFHCTNLQSDYAENLVLKKGMYLWV